MKKGPLHIGLDLDGTLVHFRKPPVREAYRRAGYRRGKRSLDYNFSDLPEDVREAVWALFADPGYMVDLVVISGVKKKLKEWASEGHRLTLISARSYEPVRVRTRVFVAEQFPQISEMFFVDLGVPKTDIFRDKKIDVWVDDNPEDTVDAAKMGIYTCLVTNSHTAYNQHVKGSSILHTYPQVTNINIP